MLPQSSPSTESTSRRRPSRSAYREMREQLAHEACYEQQVKMAEARQRRIDAMIAKTAAETPWAAGDILWA